LARILETLFESGVRGSDIDWNSGIRRRGCPKWLSCHPAELQTSLLIDEASRVMVLSPMNISLRGEFSSMTLPQSILNRGVKSCVRHLVAVGLLVAGCNSETIPPSPGNRVLQQEAAVKGVDQSAISKSGKRSGKPIITKSVKSLIKKDAVE
jgi:hypothetical protein